jgi:taurine--2-oxoglutarate transaminase
LGAYSPLAATIFSETVAAEFDSAIFGHGQSFSAHALASAAALASLEVVTRDGFLDAVRQKGDYLGSRLTEMAQRHRCVGDVRGICLFWTVELVRPGNGGAALRRFTDKYADGIMQRISRYLLEEQNIYVPGDKFGIWVVPPLIVSRDEIDWLVAGIDAALTQADGWLDAPAEAPAACMPDASSVK